MKQGPRKVRGKTARQVFNDYKHNCFSRDKYWGIEYEVFEKLIVAPCHYCGRKGRNNRRGFIYTGIDRKNNKKGYHRKNTVPCCKRCNSIKGENLSYTEMLAVAKTLKRVSKG